MSKDHKDEIDKVKVGPSSKGPDDADTSTKKYMETGNYNLCQASQFVLYPKYHNDAGHYWKRVPGPSYHLKDNEICSEASGYLLEQGRRLSEEEIASLRSIKSIGTYSLNERIAIATVALRHRELWQSSELDHLNRIKVESKAKLRLLGRDRLVALKEPTSAEESGHD